MKAKFTGAALTLLLALGFIQCTKDRIINEPGNLVPKTVDQDPSLPSIAINGAQLHAEAFGPADSALIVVVHGGPGSDYRHLLNCQAFAGRGYRVVFYDQRGSGLSERFPKDSYTLQTMIDDLKAVIQHYRTSPAQQVFLLGHSWGAILATSYINTYPDAVDGAVLAEPGGLVWDDIADYVKRSRSIVMTKELFNDMLYSDQFITGKEDQHAILDYKYALLSAADGNPDNPIGDEGPVPFWRSGAVVNQALFELGNDIEPDWTTNLDQFTTKVLFIYSENNEAYGLAHAQKVSSAYPNVELFETLDAGHDMLSFPTGWNNTFPKMLQYFNNLKH
ncbi:MAG: alpha/beta hydrolase [Thermoanaerobaculia bacterium]|nr:alpha/beta hydrolase [Thermoanaerobaculia bacterium]